ncbi:MAG TPA: c-type cytochrome domain-containing protein [Myxococcales bacterium]|nr:c-type cytochrome domain-containing protein [Myxococcales bacterium]
MARRALAIALGAGALAAACLVPVEDQAGKSCVYAQDCPPPLTCVPLRTLPGRSCEYVPAPDVSSSADELDGGGGTYCRDARPLFDAYCVACHGADNVLGNLRLDIYTADGGGAVPGAFDRADRIKLRTYDTRTMPPAGALAYPGDGERITVARWVVGGAVECDDAGVP